MKIKDLSIEQKLRLLVGKDGWSTDPLDGAVPSLRVSDGPIGLRYVGADDKVIPHTAFPATQTLANTWDPTLARAMGEAIADDCIEENVDILLGPGANIKRAPQDGRNFEYFSEDPYLAGKMARSYIEGVQGRGVGTSLKHFCCNNIEINRFYRSSEVDERTLREIYLAPFEEAVKGKPDTVMCSYNLVNGRRMSEHKKLYGTLRNEFGFDGAIVSDWCAVMDPVASVKAGLDLQMPFSKEAYPKLKAAYEAGELTEAEIDACVGRLLALIEHRVAARKTRKVGTTAAERRALAQTIAEQGMVLLKNNGVLPLAPRAKIAILGGMTDGADVCGDGSAHVTPAERRKPLRETLQAELPEARIDYQMGVTNDPAPLMFDLDRALALADASDIAIVGVGDNGYLESESRDRTTLRLHPWLESMILQTASYNPNTVVVIYAGAPVEVGPWADKVAAIVWAGFSGECVNEALAGVLSGRVNPCGKLSETFPLTLSDAPCEHTYEDAFLTCYSEGLLVGYRYYDTTDTPVSYPFGYGLSYSEYVYSDLSLAQTAPYTVEVSFSVTNASGPDGAEIAQVYVRDVQAHVFRPFKELKGFAKIALKAGETKRVTLTLDKRAFAYWSAADDCWTVEPGRFEILVGADCEDIRLSDSVTL